MNRQFYEDKAVEVMDCLKNFQRATVERIDHLFRSGQRRVLVADEVGLGKTLIARGCIAKTALIDDTWTDGIYKVVYVCSNQNLARKNILKLNIFGVDEINDIADNRLSMQHLKIVQKQLANEEKHIEVQLIPLTPQTSFNMTTGEGSISERALMYAILMRMEEFANVLPRLRTEMVRWATKSEYILDAYVKEVERCHRRTVGRQEVYPDCIIEKIRCDYADIIAGFANHLRTLAATQKADAAQIGALRTMFAHISVERLQPDLVVMDEFQRFKFLLDKDDANDNSEMRIIARKFLTGGTTRVLLLSATPYKLYSTMEEIEENAEENHYEEFNQVMRFLFDDGNRYVSFQKAWKEYTEEMRHIKQLGISTVQAAKGQAQEALYGGMCRTERLSVMDGADFINDASVKKAIDINGLDVRSYCEIRQLVEMMPDAGYGALMDYVKSCPFLLSFMTHYALMDKVRRYFRKHLEQEAALHRKTLWLNTVLVNSYQALPATNARLEALKQVMFSQHKSHLYMWVPPSMPYYEMRGVYKGSEGFSKLLLFSAWEMVPRMVGALISYEAERLTIGKLAEQAKKEGRRNTNYFRDGKKRRFPASRLHGGSELYLLYPSKVLSELYDPIACHNEGLTLADIKKRIKGRLQELLVGMKDRVNGDKRTIDNSWYVIAPMLLDGKEYVQQWLEVLNDEDKSSGSDRLTIARHIKRFQDEGIDFDCLEMGRIPSDLADQLTNMAIASPVQCIYRANKGNLAQAVELARIFINRFNSPEGTAIVDLASNRRRDDDSHWQNVIHYCEDGNFQAMIDEYRHMATEDAGLSAASNKEDKVHRIMCEALTLHTATYTVETEASFRAYIHDESFDGELTRMRAHYAVGFVNSGKSETDKGALRKEGIQNAFNSPLRPFVLASTSIGQEGLDFHTYCRRIMHWNLPGNPIDFEQREGRVNRYKCLAIRQNLARKYSGLHIDKDVWTEIFSVAERDFCPKGESELKPYWCLGENQDIKIERLIPMYPLSRDQQRYERLIKILSLYCLTMGQARQEELLQYIFNNFEESKQLHELFMDLSPFSNKTK